jgi:hypothetical protein
VECSECDEIDLDGKLFLILRRSHKILNFKVENFHSQVGRWSCSIGSIEAIICWIVVQEECQFLLISSLRQTPVSLVSQLVEMLGSQLSTLAEPNLNDVMSVSQIGLLEWSLRRLPFPFPSVVVFENRMPSFFQ